MTQLCPVGRAPARGLLALGLVLLLGLLSACGSSAPAAATGLTQMIEVTISGKTVTPEPHTVDVALGTTVTIKATSDHFDQLHVHGYDIPATLTPNSTVSITFVANQPGRYEVETHGAGHLRLFALLVR